MLNFKEFEAIKALIKNNNAADLHEYILKNTYFELFSGIDEVKAVVDSLIKKGYLKDNHVTELAFKEIEPCKVHNAIILAAGGAAKSSKSIYSLPKGLYIKMEKPLLSVRLNSFKQQELPT